MAGRGLYEVVGWSFAEPSLLDRLRLPPEHEMRRVVTLENPLSDAQSIMRPTLLGSLLDAARHNVARNGPDVAIFESGTVYRALDDASGGGEAGGGAGDRAADRVPRIKRRGADEHHALGVLLSGALAPRSWLGEPAQADFFAAKALLAGLLDSLHVHWSVKEAQWPFLHPGRSAAVLARVAGGGASAGAEGGAARDGEPLTLGFVGELHPLVAKAWDIERTTAAFAIDLGKLALVAPEVVSFHAFGSFPVLRQDLAVTLPDDVPARAVLHGVRRAGGNDLDGAEIFDVYTGSQVGEGRRSLALALSFRSLERTLTDEDVAPARERIVAALAELGGELRG